MQLTEFGRSIEDMVCQFLQSEGLETVQKNYYCRLGEIDLIMFDNISHTLIFIEVRFRASGFHGNATETVDWKKQRKLKRTVLHYLQKLGDARQLARIDVVGVSRYRTTDDCDQNTQALPLENVSVHRVNEFQLVWTQNAVLD